MSQHVATTVSTSQPVNDIVRIVPATDIIRKPIRLQRNTTRTKKTYHQLVLKECIVPGNSAHPARDCDNMISFD